MRAKYGRSSAMIIIGTYWRSDREVAVLVTRLTNWTKTNRDIHPRSGFERMSQELKILYGQCVSHSREVPNDLIFERPRR